MAADVKSPSSPPPAVVRRGRFFLFVWLVRLKYLVVQTVTAVALTAFVAWMSVFMYAAFYYVYMPVKAHEWPLHLRFRTDCDVDNRLCSFPMANISLMTTSAKPVLVHGQAYVVSVEIEMPESLINQNLGMFLVQVQFYAKHGDIVFTSSRSSMLQYRSFIQRTAETIAFLPFSIFRSSSPTQTVSTELTDNYQEDPYRPAVGVVVEVHNKKVEIYSMVLKIHARFSGLRYLLHYWPVLSAILGISSNFFFLSIVVFFSWIAFLARSSGDLRERTDGRQSDSDEISAEKDTSERTPTKEKQLKELLQERLNQSKSKSPSDQQLLMSSLRKRNR